MLNFVHITDCHLGDSRDTNYKGINSYQSLEKICGEISRLPDIDFILVTGDISQTGNKVSYELFNSAISPLKPPVYCLPGNHDNPVLLKEFFPNSPVDHVSYLQLNDIFLLLFNTTIAGKEYGEISSDLINELEYFFTHNPQASVIVAMHHPLINCDTPWMDKIGIQHKEQQIEYFIRRENIKLVLNGHVHMAIEEVKNNTHFYATPSTCYQFKKHAGYAECDTLMPGYRMITIKEELNISTQLVRINL